MEMIYTCDFCDAQALIDGKTIMGPWAYMCPDHLKEFGYPDSEMNTRLVTKYPSKDYDSRVHK